MSTSPSTPSANRLWTLISERLKADADRAAIDRRIWNLFGETWAVMYTDLAGFSRKVEAFGIIHFLQVIYEAKRLFGPAIEAHDGLLLKEEGDSLLIIFRQPAQALDCAVAMQRAAMAYSANLPDEDKVELCLGLGYGQVLRVGDNDVYGPEVNAACKLGEDHAKRGEILLTQDFLDAIQGERPTVEADAMHLPVPGSAGGHRLRWTP